MKNFSKFLGILTVLCENSIIASDMGLVYSIVDAEAKSINTSIMLTSKFIQSAVNTTFNIVDDLALNIEFNLLIQSFINNNNMQILDSVINNMDEITKKCKNNIISSLLDINVNIPSEYQTKESNMIHFYLCCYILDNALKQNNVPEISRIMVYLNKQFATIKYEMYGNLYVIKNMSQDSKNKLKSLLISTEKSRYEFVDRYIHYLNEKYKKLSSMKFDNQNFDLIRCNILEIIANKLDFLKTEKECFKELGIDPATVA